MAQIGSTRYLERVQFFNGERLFASDLQTLEEFQREMRWLHNKSLHQPGVASGFAVSGEKGDRQVTVQPGYAIDSSGREIVLTEQQHIEAVPPVADDGSGNPVTFYLTVSYPATLVASQTQQPDCSSDPPGAVRLSEVPVFCWVRLNSTASAGLLQDIENGQRILLATAQVLNCQLYQKISIAQRTNAKPGVHPYIYSATANVPWSKGTMTFQPTQFGVELQSTGTTVTHPPIDTTAGGFLTSPSYFVALAGNRSVPIDDKGDFVTLTPLLSVAVPKMNQFTLSLMIPGVLLGGFTATQVAGRLNELIGANPIELDWKIEWMGVEE
jgi:hypothetical protein